MVTPDNALLLPGGILLLRPLWLLAVLPLGLLLWRVCRSGGQRQSGWEAVIDPHLRPHVLCQSNHAGRGLAPILIGVGAMIAIIALAGPALPGTTGIALRNDAARVLVLEMSPAMAEGDPAATPAERLRLKLLDLLGAMPDGQTALIAYAEEPYLVAPPTTDTATLKLLVPELAPDIMPTPGNRPDRALRMAADLLQRSGAAQRDVLWMTNTSPPPAESLQAAALLRGAASRLSVLHLPAAQPSPADATASLRQLTRENGGLFLSLRADTEDVRELAAFFADAGTPASKHLNHRATPQDLGPWLLPLLLPLAALAFRRGTLLVLALPFFLAPPPADAADFTPAWLQRERRAQALLHSGDTERAAREFKDPRWQAVAHYRGGRFAEAAAILAPFTDADSLYNRGNAFARQHRLDEALQCYETALALRPDDDDIRHNRDLVRALKQQPPPPQPEASNPPDAPPPPASGGNAATPPKPARGSPRPGDATASQARPHDHQREADELANQWLRRVPDDPGGLLQHKLQFEHQRRLRGEGETSWR